MIPMQSSRTVVGRVTPCAPVDERVPRGAHRVTRPTGLGSGFGSPAVRGPGILSRNILVLLLMGLLTAAQAGEFTADFEQANKLYEQGKFTEAVAAYEKVIDSGRCSAALYFNLGNALLKDGQRGRAIISYRLAERLTPRDPDLQSNLKFARDSASGGTPDNTDFWWRWLGTLSLNEWTLLTIVAAWLWFALLILRLWKPALKKSLRSYTATTGVIGGGLALCLAAVCWEQKWLPRAVVIVREAVVRYGPLEESQAAFSARDGAELTVRDRKGGWLWVTDPSGRLGWVRHEQVYLMPPSAELFRTPAKTGGQ